ncbi:hypothetical protein BDA99DRAFT_594820 [Phascolomyces articulosus]|uniref:Uncharacterized protein n=1 Tax=Phascolomyces articulosus TaxID=60185 RepID=A0AAD5PHF0_9FUNG|nr:hypothetical protein BDA99DRAFT_594820 [Phascolomyces articulosus]
MMERTSILQTKFLLSIPFLPENALLTKMLPIIIHQPKSKCHTLHQSPLWNQLPEPKDLTSNSIFKTTKKLFLHQRLEHTINDNPNRLLALCRPKLILNPILWILMTRKERSCYIRWRMGWLSGGRPKPCIKFRYHSLNK